MDERYCRDRTVRAARAIAAALLALCVSVGGLAGRAHAQFITFSRPASSGSGAPNDATYITQTPSAGLTSEQALSTLSVFEPGMALPLDDYGTLDVAALERGELYAVADVAALPAVPKNVRRLMQSLGIRAYVRVPMIQHGQVVGCLNCWSSRTRRWELPTSVYRLAASIAAVLS